MLSDKEEVTELKLYFYDFDYEKGPQHINRRDILFSIRQEINSALKTIASRIQATSIMHLRGRKRNVYRQKSVQGKKMDAIN